MAFSKFSEASRFADPAPSRITSAVVLRRPRAIDSRLSRVRHAVRGEPASKYLVDHKTQEFADSERVLVRAIQRLQGRATWLLMRRGRV